ncbi:MAG TPA: DUF222 domain-containing protein [Amycolatopsis sp.]
MSTTTGTHEVWQLQDEELTAFLLACEEKLRRDHAEMLGLVNEVERRGLGRTLGFKDTAAMLRETLRVSAREATTRVVHACATGPSSSPTGVPQPASLAATGQALADGLINREHVQAIVGLFATCPAAIGPGNRAADEATLIALAAQAAPESLRTAGRRLLAYWADYSTPPDDRRRRELHPSRRLHITHRSDGSSRFAGELDPATTAVLDGLLGPLAKPRLDPETEGPDPRSAAERRGDALADILELAARCDDLAVQGGERAVMIVTVTLAELEGRLTDALSTIPGSLDELRRQVCEAKVVPAILRHRRAATAPRAHHAAGHPGPAARPGLARQGMCPPRLRPHAEVVHRPPCDPLVGGRAHRPVEPGPALPRPPPAHPPQRLDDPDAGRDPRVPATIVARSRPHPAAQPHP